MDDFVEWILEGFALFPLDLLVLWLRLSLPIALYIHLPIDSSRGIGIYGLVLALGKLLRRKVLLLSFLLFL